MKKVFSTLFVFAGLCLTACGAKTVSVPQKGWDKYAGSMKSTLEDRLTLRYVWLHDKNLSSGEAVYYRGNYGNYTDPERASKTTFYFVYNVENDSIESGSEYIYSLAQKMSSSYSSTVGILIDKN